MRNSTHVTHRPQPANARVAAAIVATIALALLVAACGGSPPSVGSVGSSNQGGATTSQLLAYARCMRAHGVANFPDPDPQGNFPPLNAGGPQQIASAARQTCQHLLSGGGGTGRGRNVKVEFALQVAQCMHSHEFPTYPEPTLTGQGYAISFIGTGIDAKSPQFQTAQTACEKRAQQALRVSIGNG